MTAATRGVVAELHALADPERLPGMARVGINIERAIGVSLPHLRKLGRRLGPDHLLALDLWSTGIHEARILASLVDDPADVTREQMDAWARDFDSWDICDQVVGNLFERTPYVVPAAHSWTERDETFVKRAGFVLIATRAVHDRMSPDGLFTAWFPTIRRGRDRRSQLREEGRQLGPPSDRETEPGAQRGRDRSGRDARRIHGDQCAMGGTRRPPRTPAR